MYVHLNYVGREVGDAGVNGHDLNTILLSYKPINSPYVHKRRLISIFLQLIVSNVEIIGRKAPS